MSSEADHKAINLRGSGVLITRPREQSMRVSALVSASGGVPYVFPCLEITLCAATKLQIELEKVSPGDLLIFVSANAVRGVFQHITPVLRKMLAKTQIAAVGKRTQQALEDERICVAAVPENGQQNTEGLLQHPVLAQVQQRRAFIVRGQAGREALADELGRRGAKVSYIQAYTRSVPEAYDRDAIIKALKAGQIQYAMLASFAAFENLRLMLGHEADTLLHSTQLLVPGGRVAGKIREHHAFIVSEAENASDQSMLSAINYRGRRPGYQSPGRD